MKGMAPSTVVDGAVHCRHGQGTGARQPAATRLTVRYIADTGKALALDSLFLCSSCRNCEMPEETETRPPDAPHSPHGRARLKGPFDVEEEIDYVFCPACLEHVPEVEAKLFGYRCAKCFLCPVCFAQLQTAAVNVDGDGGATARGGELYMFACGFCKWESSSIGVMARETSELVLSRLKAEREDPHDKLVARLASEMAALSATPSNAMARTAPVARAPGSLPHQQGKLYQSNNALLLACSLTSRKSLAVLTRNGCGTHTRTRTRTRARARTHAHIAYVMQGLLQGPGRRKK